MTEEPTLTLQVAYGLEEDINKGRVRVDTSTRFELGLIVGDAIRIDSGKRITTAIVWRSHPYDEGLKLIRMEPSLLNNLGRPHLGQNVVISRIVPQKANKIVFQSEVEVPKKLLISRLYNRPCVAGDQLMISNTRSIRVISTVPDGIVQITDDTVFEEYCQKQETRKDDLKREIERTQQQLESLHKEYNSIPAVEKIAEKYQINVKIVEAIRDELINNGV